jgi:hypothetical protein
MGRYANEAVTRGTIQKVQSVRAQPPQSLALDEGVCWNIYSLYLASVYIVQLR